jgi:hypothetical protein
MLGKVGTPCLVFPSLTRHLICQIPPISCKMIRHIFIPRPVTIPAKGTCFPQPPTTNTQQVSVWMFCLWREQRYKTAATYPFLLAGRLVPGLDCADPEPLPSPVRSRDFSPI